jgi:hypothetical protein
MSPAHIARTLNREVTVEAREDGDQYAVFRLDPTETANELLTLLDWPYFYNIHSAQDADYVELPL